MIPQEIFHYTKMGTALENILSGKKLRLNQMGLTNDPRESKDWSIDKPYFLNPKNDREVKVNALMTHTLDKVVPKVMKEEWKVLCFTFEHPISDKLIGEPIKQIEHYYFHPSYALPRMWAQYAENHKGVCILFDGNKLDHNLRRSLGQRCIIYHGEVQYNIVPGAMVLPPFPKTIMDDIEKLGTLNAARKYVLENYSWFFLRKHPDWETETEYRWLVHSKKHAPEFVPIEGAIKSVLVGADFPKIYEPSVRALCKDLKIPAGRIKWVNGVPFAEFESIYQP